MTIECLQLGELGTNCYLLPCGEGEVILIDIGNSAGRLMHYLETKGLTPKAILLTHDHFDHVAGVEHVRARYEIPVYIHEADANMLRSGEANLCWQISDSPFTPVKEFNTLRDGDVLTIGDRTIKVIHTPGHTPGGVCFRTGDVMFTGDTLFHLGMGRTDLGGNVPEMRRSLALLAGLDGDPAIYPGHGGSSTLAFERENDPYLGGL